MHVYASQCYDLLSKNLNRPFSHLASLIQNWRRGTVWPRQLDPLCDPETPGSYFPCALQTHPMENTSKNSKLWSYFQLGSFPMDCQYLLLASAAVFALSQYLTAAMSLLILNHQSQYSRMKSPTFETFTPSTKAISSTISKLIPLCICKSPLLPSRIWAKHFQAENKAFSGNVFFDIFETLWRRLSHCVFTGAPSFHGCLKFSWMPQVFMDAPIRQM